MKVRRTFLAVAIIVSMIATACQTKSTKIEIDLRVTKNFGSSVVLKEKVTCQEGETVMDLLQRKADVKTAYGGGFVESINGIKSSSVGASYDWFYYVNGKLAPKGAAETQLHARDEVWWDFHRWDSPKAKRTR